MSTGSNEHLTKGPDAQTSPQAAPSGPSTRVQFKRQLAHLSYDEQVQLLQPPQTAAERVRPAPASAEGDAVQHSAEATPTDAPTPGGGSGAAPVQMERTKPVHTAETPTATDVPSVGRTPPQLAWRKVNDNGKIGWYVVQVEPGKDPGELANGVHPDEAFSMAANPANEAAADAFEQAVGNHAMGSGEAKGAAKALADKAVEVTEAYLKAMTEAGAKQAELDTAFQDLLGGMGPTWAGSAAVPIPEAAPDKAKLAAENVARIKAVQASGNVREMVNLGVSFMYKFGDVQKVQTRAINMQTFYEEARAKVGTLKSGVADFTATLERRIKEGSWVTPVDDNATVSGQQGSSRIKNPDSKTGSKRKVGSLGDYAQLSENEKLVMFGPEATREKELKQQILTWSEGRKVWYMNEGDTFVQECREASIPMGGGVSGTTMRIMELSQVFNTGNSAVNMRAAAIGYLLPIRAHTLIEIMKGAEPYGAGSVPSPPSYAIYADIQPWGDLSHLGNATMKKLIAQTKKKGA